MGLVCMVGLNHMCKWKVSCTVYGEVLSLRMFSCKYWSVDVFTVRSTNVSSGLSVNLKLLLTVQTLGFWLVETV